MEAGQNREAKEMNRMVRFKFERRPWMKQQDEKSTTDRRSFLKMAGLGTVAGSAALLTDSPSAKAAVTETTDGQTYQETKHIKTYYDLARF